MNKRLPVLITLLVFGGVELMANTKPVINSSSFSVKENVLKIGTLDATDADGDILRYEVLNSDEITIGRNSGVLRFNNSPDFEKKRRYRLKVKVSDGIRSVSKIITIKIQDVKEKISVDLSSSFQSADVGDRVLLKWSSTNAKYCIASGAWAGKKSKQGKQSLKIENRGSNTYGLRCIGKGTNATKDIKIRGTKNCSTKDCRIPFTDFSDTVTSRFSENEIKVSYLFPSFNPKRNNQYNKNYKIIDSGFLRFRVDGRHPGQKEPGEEEYIAPGPWTILLENIIATDINNDGAQDILLKPTFIGTNKEWPPIRLLAFINTNGHFKLDCTVFDGGECPLVAGISSGKDRNLQPWGSEDDGGFIGIDINNNTAKTDFNNDGIIDFFDTGVLWVSDSGTYMDQSHLFPDFMYENSPYMNLGYEWEGEDIGIFLHDTITGDLNNDGYQDVYAPNGTIVFGTADNPLCCGSEYQYNEFFTKFLLINSGTADLSEYDPTIFDKDLVYKRVISGWVSDLDADGYSDLVVGIADTPYWGRVYWGNSKGTFIEEKTRLPKKYWSRTDAPLQIQALDFDNDGELDLVAQTVEEDIPNGIYYESHTYQFFKNLGNRKFKDVTAEVFPEYEIFHEKKGPSGMGGGRLMIEDFDGDGDLDIIHPDNKTYILLNNGKGKFRYGDLLPPVNRKSEYSPGNTRFPIDINGDNKLDFIGVRPIKSNDPDNTVIAELYLTISK
jgi:hypothetical protein